MHCFLISLTMMASLIQELKNGSFQYAKALSLKGWFLIFCFLIFGISKKKKKKMTRNFQKINDILLCDKIDAIFELLDGNRESFISM